MLFLCSRCRKTLTSAEIIERWCITCNQTTNATEAQKK